MAEAAPGKPNEAKKEKRTITEIRESKKTGEKMVYMSVPDYTSAQWAEMAGVDVAVRRRQPCDDRARPPQHDPRHHGHDGAARGRRCAAARRTRSCSAACRTRATTRSTARSSTRRASCRRRAATRSSRRAASRRRISCKRAGRRGHPDRLAYRARRRTRSRCSAASRSRAAPPTLP